MNTTEQGAVDKAIRLGVPKEEAEAVSKGFRYLEKNFMSLHEGIQKHTGASSESTLHMIQAYCSMLQTSVDLREKLAAFMERG